jgi:thiamine pyrophosphate-dependent acetolactate synthase large subunit-like protein
VARALADNGVDTVFGLLGDANMFHVAEFVHARQGRFVGAVAEGGAVSMADGYARVSGRVGVASVTHGPGAANTINAMVEAVRAHSPVVLITGDTPAQRGHPQQIDLNALFGATGADYHRVLSPELVVDDIAITLARVAATRRPLVLDIPIDVQNAEIEYLPSRSKPVPPPRVRPDPAALDAALGALASASHPLILAGRGAVLSGARESLIELADLLGAPLASTASAKDIFFGHPYNLGVMGNLGLDWAGGVVAKADCIAAFGAGLNRFTTADGDLLNGCTVIHCDVEAGHIGRLTPVDFPVCADAAATAEAMVEMLRAADVRPRAFRTTMLGDGVLEFSPRDDFQDRSSDTALDMRTAMIILEEMLPADKVVATDAGRFKSAPWRYLHVTDARNFLQAGAWASIGLGIAAAIGAAVAAPHLRTVGVAGDGGGMMGLIEFSTAVRHQIPLVVVILNDGAYGAEYAKFEQHGYDAKNSYVDWPEFAEVATALGGVGVTVRTADELRATADLLNDLTTPLLIDIKADPTVNPLIP